MALGSAAGVLSEKPPACLKGGASSWFLESRVQVSGYSYFMLVICTKTPTLGCRRAQRMLIGAICLAGNEDPETTSSEALDSDRPLRDVPPMRTSLGVCSCLFPPQEPQKLRGGSSFHVESIPELPFLAIL